MKKILFIILTSFILMSCADSAINNNQIVSDTLIDSNLDTSIEIEAMVSDLPSMNFEGKSFTFYIRITPDDFSADDVVAYEQNGEPINDAVYQRNLFIEDKYNTKISAIEAPISHSVYNPVKNSILANDNLFDVIVSYGYDAASFAQEGLIHDLKSIKYIDLTKPWWSPTLSETLSIQNRQFYATGDISYIDNLGIRCFYFNKDIVNDLMLENPYELVNDNKWTIPKLFEMAIHGNQDLNGDGVMNEEDRFGIQAQSSLGGILMYAGGVSITKKDNDDLPVLAVDQLESITILDTIKTYMDKNESIHYSDNWLNTQNRFAEGKVLFQAEVMLMIQSMRGAEVNMGIIPSPKFDENQENFIHFLDAHCMNMYSIPVTATEIDDIGFILEAMAFESVNTLTPAFYDICLNGKYIRDMESSEMLDIIFDSYVMENAEMYGWGSLMWMIQDSLKQGKDVVSIIEANKTPAITALDKSITSLNDNYK